MNSTSRWIPLLFGSVMLLMAALILGALCGIVPTDGGRFLAPPLIIAAIGVCLLCGGLALWIPAKTPAIVRSGLFLVALASMATACNWTAFAPDVLYYSSTSIGPLQFTGEDQVGGRIVFGLAAVAVDGLILYLIIAWARSSLLKR